MWGAVFAILEHSGSHTLNELDDGKIYRKALYVMVKSMVSCKFSLKPIHWYTVAMYRSCWASHLLQAVQRFRGYPATESHARHSGWSQEPGYIHRDRWTWFVWKNLVARKIDGWSVDHCFSTFSHGFPIVFPLFSHVFPLFSHGSRWFPVVPPFSDTVRAWRFGVTAPVSVSPGRWSQRWRATDIWRTWSKSWNPWRSSTLTWISRAKKVGPWYRVVPCHGMMAWWRSGVDAMNSERFALRWSLGLICALQLCFQKFTRAWTRDSSELATGGHAMSGHVGYQTKPAFHNHKTENQSRPLHARFANLTSLEIKMISS